MFNFTTVTAFGGEVKIYLDMNLFENVEVKQNQPEMAMMKLQNI